MALRSLRIEQFRGIHSAEVNFDRTTILIGENDCGMSTVLEALALALSHTESEPPRFKPSDVHDSCRPVSIELTFVESRAGSWGRPGLEALTPVLGKRADKPRTLVLELTSDSKGKHTDARWIVRTPHGGTSRDDLDVLDAVRRINPFVWLRHNEIRNKGYEQVLGDQTGLAATKRLLEEWAPGIQPQGPQMRAMVTEILEHGKAPSKTAGARTSPRSFAGSSAQQLGVFLVAAQLVHQLRSTSSPGVRPIILLEEPEAHLHPMTQASVWSLLELFPSTQKIVTTHSGGVLAAAPLQSVRRLVRDAGGVVRQWRVGTDRMRSDDLRKVGYHLRARRSVACFARVWLLVEGETEFWIMPDLARLCGYDFAQEGIVCVEFAQSGLVPLIKFANSLGIAWHILTDGDRAGDAYTETARPYLRDRSSQLTRLAELDIEHCFWKHGYAPVFERLAKKQARGNVSPTRVIKKAIENRSKPGVAFELLAAVAARGEDGPPAQLRTAIDICVGMARGQTRKKESAT